MLLLSWQPITLIVCFTLRHLLPCGGAASTAPNIAFITHKVLWGNFLNNDISLDIEMSMRDIITVEDGTMCESSDFHCRL